LTARPSKCAGTRESASKVFKGVAKRGKCSMGWFFGFKQHLICNEKGELLNFMISLGGMWMTGSLLNIRLS
jgi:hypothetical protein